MPELSANEAVALEVLRRAFYDGSPHVAPRTIGHAVFPDANPLGASSLGGRLATSLARNGLALRSHPSWDNNPKSPYYRITAVGREIASNSIKSED